jgi:hypothetical protein
MHRTHHAIDRLAAHDLDRWLAGPSIQLTWKRQNRGLSTPGPTVS